MFNVTIAGRLTKDAQYKQAGTYDMATFTVAVDHGKEKTSYVDCQIWGKIFVTILDTYKKGHLVAVSGNGQYLTYETEDGSKRKKLTVNVKSFIFPEKRESANVEEETATIPF